MIHPDPDPPLPEVTPGRKKFGTPIGSDTEKTIFGTPPPEVALEVAPAVTPEKKWGPPARSVGHMVA